MKLKIITIIVLVILGIIILNITFSPSKTTDEIKIGVILPLTGIASLHGQNEKQGIDLAVEEINKAGGINGRSIKIIYEDDQTDSKRTVLSLSKLAEIDKVTIVIGGTWDILANAIIPEATKKKIVVLSPSALPDTLEQESPYFFSVHSPVAVNQEIFEQYIRENNVKTAAILNVNNPWGIAHRDTFRKAAANTGVDILEERTIMGFDNNDIATDMTLIKAKNPDMIFVTLNFNDMALFGKKRVELDMKSKILAHSNFASTIEGGRLPKELGEGVTIFQYSEPSESFIKKFKEKYEKAPEIYSDIAYDTIYILKEVIEKEGVEPDNVIKGIREIKLQGVSGEIYFGNNNFPENKRPILQIITNK